MSQPTVVSTFASASHALQPAGADLAQPQRPSQEAAQLSAERLGAAQRARASPDDEVLAAAGGQAVVRVKVIAPSGQASTQSPAEDAAAQVEAQPVVRAERQRVRRAGVHARACSRRAAGLSMEHREPAEPLRAGQAARRAGKRIVRYLCRSRSRMILSMPASLTGRARNRRG